MKGVHIRFQLYLSSINQATMRVTLAITTLFFLLIVAIIATGHARSLNMKVREMVDDDEQGLYQQLTSLEDSDSEEEFYPSLRNEAVIRAGCEAKCRRKDKHI